MRIDNDRQKRHRRNRPEGIFSWNLKRAQRRRAPSHAIPHTNSLQMQFVTAKQRSSSLFVAVGTDPYRFNTDVHFLEGDACIGSIVCNPR